MPKVAPIGRRGYQVRRRRGWAPAVGTGACPMVTSATTAIALRQRRRTLVPPRLQVRGADTQSGSSLGFPGLGLLPCCSARCSEPLGAELSEKLRRCCCQLLGPGFLTPQRLCDRLRREPEGPEIGLRFFSQPSIFTREESKHGDPRRIEALVTWCRARIVRKVNGLGAVQVYPFNRDVPF